MKKLLALLLLVAMPAFVLTSCSDDDDDDKLAKTVAGSYTGTLKYSFMGTDEEGDVSVVISAEGDNTIKMTFSIPIFGINVPISVDNVNITGTVGSVTIPSTKVEESLAGIAEISGTISGSITSSKTLKVAINLSVDTDQVSGLAVTGEINAEK